MDSNLFKLSFAKENKIEYPYYLLSLLSLSLKFPKLTNINSSLLISSSSIFFSNFLKPTEQIR